MNQREKPVDAVTLPEALDLLSKEGWFAERSDVVRAELASIARLRVFETGAALYSVGDMANGVFGLVAGALDISIPRTDGNDFTFHAADPGFWVGDLALMSSAKRLVSVHAATKVAVIHLGAGELKELVERKPMLLHDFYALSYQNFATTFFLLANISIASSESRVALRLLMHLEHAPDPEGWVYLSQIKLGELVALSQPTLQRVMRRLHDLDCIEPGYGKIRITDRGKLLSICGDNATALRQLSSRSD
ncbi:Crp/Fnr family transcriptional regulator [Paracoccus litorisediminis]|uniref:Cyclic nucleotide-binding domain-containing protein n=1 Tax=Paracoccus litorisediminis TaxID=2006130 RepID=A0A844HND9_9RHOB|nr:Crp/Fnr family transcriptional regulator [Paracoccus litorisediminis]MTH61843.1 cyclic nucleotide-binding domain-containing protein [Paracoccus litorisediminis]